MEREVTVTTTSEPKDYLQILWRQRWQILLTFTLVIAGTLVATYLTTPLYSATNKVMLENRPASAGAALYAELYWLLRPEVAVDVQIELIKSRPIVEQALRKADFLRTAPGDPGYTPEQFQGVLKVRSPEGSNIFHIVVQDPDPVRAAQLANAVAGTYVEDNIRNSRAEVSGSLTFIENQLASVRKDLSQAENALKNFKLGQKVSSLTDETRMTIDQAAQAETNLNQRRLALQDAETRVAALRSRLGLTPGAAITTSAVSFDPKIQNIRSQIVEAETKLATNSELTASHPDMQELRSQITRLRALLDREVARIAAERPGSGAGARTNMDPVTQVLAQDLVRADVDRLAYQSQIGALQNLSKQLQNRLSGLPGREVEMARLMRSAEVSGNLYKMLLQKREEVKLLQPVTGGNARVIEPAMAPTVPDVPKKGANLLLGILAGLVLGVAFALFTELLDDTIRSSDEAQAYLKAYPMLGLMPWRRDDKDREGPPPHLFIVKEPRSAAAEAVRAIRTNIRFLNADRPITAFTITSWAPGEGKSHLMANLAASLAQTDKKVVLIDTDLRNPVQYKIFGQPNAPGVTDVLMGEATLDQALQVTPVAGLSLLPTGPLPPNPLELIESKKMQELLTELRKRFDYVLCDAPAIGPVTDATVLASHLDGIIYLAAVDRVSARGLRRALDHLKVSKVRVLGGVVRQRKADATREYDYYYHYHQDPSGKKPKDQSRKDRA